MALPEDEVLLERIKSCYRIADEHTKDWRAEARELYDMVAGHQWDAVTEAKMQEQLRPIVTFNVAGKFLDAVSGLQINNRQEIRYFPREPGDVKLNEILTGAAAWARDEADAEDEETDAFFDMLVCGLGCTETSISFDENPQGEIAIERRDPLNVYWDPRGRKRNHRDGRWRMRLVRMSKEEIIERWGEDKYEDITGTMGVEPDDDMGDIHDADEAWKYEHNDLGQIKENTVPVVHYEYWARDDMFEVKSRFGTKRFTVNQWRKIEQALKRNKEQYRAVKLRAKKYYRVFAAGDVVLDADESPYQEGFTISLITGKRDRNRNTWYGIGRAVRDPQLWTNKFFSQILHTINTNAKGGLIAEEGVFADPRKAESEWANPESITYVEQGAISQNRLMNKPAAQYPQGMDRLMEFSLRALPETSGLNLELIGFADRVQPGIVEAQRKQAGMTVIAWAFDSMRRYYKDHGRCLAYYIREYVSDGRLVRITGGQGTEQYVPLLRDKLSFEFDVIVDESPTSTNMKERVWAVLTEMLPAMMKAGSPIPPDVLDYSPLPQDLAEKWKKMLQNPEGNKAKQAQQELELKERQADIEETESKKVLNLASAREKSARAGQAAAGG